MKIADIVSLLEDFAPLALQEDYDNSGLIIGDKSWDCTGALLTVDVTPTVIQEAIDCNLNLIVSHHPLIFRGVKRLSGDSLTEKCIVKAIKHDIAIYACHTNVDNVYGGVSHRMAEMIGLSDIRTLDSQNNKSLKLSTFIPHKYVDSVSNALFSAGAGRLGNYDSCSYTTEGFGSFRACYGANPFVGKIGQVHREPETKLEVILPIWCKNKVEKVLLESHPYEEPAYEFTAIDTISKTGCGAIGNLKQPIIACDFVNQIKGIFNSPIARCSKYQMDTPISRVAMCGGSGSCFLKKIFEQKTQVFITSDTKYHDFIDYADNILIIDIGHHESENCTKDIFYHIITEKFPIFAVRKSLSDKNPINYL